MLHDHVVIDVFEHYEKQSYRNRCIICSANGPLTLSVPVLKGPTHKNPVRDVRIDYGKGWRKQHLKSLESAYRSAPFYEFYMDAIGPFLEKKHQFLADLNMGLLEAILEAVGLVVAISRSDHYLEAPADKFTDYRETIHPKKKTAADPSFSPAPYSQVFEERFGFIPGLSIVDLLFNAGPDAGQVLRESIGKETS